jgi:hypothetical protein
MRESPDDQSNDVFAGIGLTFGLHLAVLVLLSLGAMLSGSPEGLVIAGLLFATLGVSQLVYIWPAVLVARRRGHPAVAKGLIIGAAITLILSGACWVIINPFTALENIH